MPCILKIRIVAARGLPIMDRGSESTDAYVEVNFGEQDVVRTSICKGTLNPVWNEDFRFEVSDDGRLQVEPLELKVMDYDQITYNDSIGTVWVDLNPLLTWDSDAQISGWMPIYDTLRGVRGELKVQIKLQFFGDVNPFKDSSAGVQFFTISTLPPNVKLTRVMGYVSSIETEDDPEHHWSDNFRTPRTSNESRTRLMYRLNGQLRRQLGMKAVELNGNAIIGYQQHFDIETENRILVARASGTVVRLIYEHGHTSKRRTARHNNSNVQDENSNPKSHLANLDGEIYINGYSGRTTAHGSKDDAQRKNQSAALKESNARSATDTPNSNTDFSEHNYFDNPVSATPPMESGLNSAAHNDSKNPLNLPYTAVEGDDNIEDDLDRGDTKTDNHVTGHSESPVAGEASKLNNKDNEASAFEEDEDDVEDIEEEIAHGNIPSSAQKHNLITLPSTVNIYTVDSFPPSTITQVGGLVSALSVKLLDEDDKESHEAWWNEIKEELKSHARSLRCTSIVGYCENVSIYEDVAVFQCQGTAANLDINKWLEFENVIAPVFGNTHEDKSEVHSLKQAESIKEGNMDGSGDIYLDGTVVKSRRKSSHGDELSRAIEEGLMQDKDFLDESIKNITSTNNSADQQHNERRLLSAKEALENRNRKKSMKKALHEGCKLCHIPYSKSSSPFPTAYHICSLCRKPKKYVPEVLLLTIDPPKELETIGEGVLVEAHVFRNKSFDGSLASVGDSVPFMQYDVHKQLMYKLRLYGMNAIFSLRIKISIGEGGAIATATGTAAYVRALPSPSPMKVHRNLEVIDEEDCKLLEIQNKIMETSETNRRNIEQAKAALYGERTEDGGLASANLDADGNDPHDSNSSIGSDSETDSDDSLRQKRGYVVHIDDEQDEDLVLLIPPSLPDGFRLYNSGNGTKSDNLFSIDQKFTYTRFVSIVRQAKIDEDEHHPNQVLANLFKSIYEEIQVNMAFLTPCVIARVNHIVNIIDDETIQVHLTAVVMGSQNVGSTARKDFTLNEENMKCLKLLDRGLEIQEINNILKRDNNIRRRLERAENSINALDSNGSPTSGDMQNDGTTLSDGNPINKPGAGTNYFSSGVLETAVNFQNYVKSHLKQSNLKTKRSGRFSSYITNSLAALRRNERFDNKVIVRSSKPMPLESFEAVSMSRKLGSNSAVLGNQGPVLDGVKEIFVTPLTYVPNYTINNFLGRISLHFVREATVQDHDGIGGAGGFTQSFWREIFSLVKAQARALGGDGVLRFVVDQSTIEEDGKHIAYGFISISGDVCSLKRNLNETNTLKDEMNTRADEIVGHSNLQPMELVQQQRALNIGKMDSLVRHFH